MSKEMEMIRDMATCVRQRLGEADTAVVLGSGLGSYAETLEDAEWLSYREIPGMPNPTAPGHESGRWWRGRKGGRYVYMLQGRVHCYEGHAMADVIRYVRAMKLLGVRHLLLTNAAGCVNTAWQPGDLMLITDEINFSGVNPLRGENLDELGPRFPDMSCVCDPGMRRACEDAAAAIGLGLRQGVYMYFMGPSYETPAEIRMARTLGADAVGMSTVPEMIAARHSGMAVLGISCMTNMAAGILDQPLSHTEVQEAAARVQTSFRALLDGTIAGLRD